MNEYKDLSELLESDSKAMAFYNSLPISLQQKMYSSGVRSFQSLYESAMTYGNRPDMRRTVMHSASVNEYTGSKPTGTS